MCEPDRQMISDRLYGAPVTMTLIAFIFSLSECLEHKDEDISHLLFVRIGRKKKTTNVHPLCSVYGHNHNYEQLIENGNEKCKDKRIKTPHR